MSYLFFGGAFDPPHIAHELLVKKFLKLFEKVFVVPSYNPPHKKIKGLGFEKRIYLLRKLFLGIENIVVTDVEKNLYEKGLEKTYTFEVIKFLEDFYGKEFALLIGADNFNSIKTWYNWEELLKNREFIIVGRAGEKLLEGNFELFDKFRFFKFDLDISSTKIRNNLKQNLRYIPKKVRKEVFYWYKHLKNIEK